MDLIFIRQAHPGAPIELCVKPEGGELIVTEVSVRKLTQLAADMMFILHHEMKQTRDKSTFL